MITRNFNLYLNAGVSVAPTINVNQYDNGEQWIFTLYEESGTRYTPSSGAIVGIKSDGKGIINSGSVNEQGQVVITETKQMTASVGKAIFELMIDDGTHGTANFIVLVEAKPGDKADYSESDISFFEEAVSQTQANAAEAREQAEIAQGYAEDAEQAKQDAIDALSGLQNDIATIESSPSTRNYSVGEYLVYNGQLYKVTSTIATGNTLSSSNISAVSVGGELKTTKDDLTTLTNKFTASTRRSRRNITADVANLPAAGSEQNLEKYNYAIGDYFVGVSGYSYHLADPDTFYGGYNNNAVVSTHHIAIVVNTNINSQWYTSNDTSKGYAGSTLHATMTDTVLTTVRNDLKALFGGTGNEHLLAHNKLYTTAVSNWEWSSTQYISALTEAQVYGTNVWSIDGYQTGEARKQLDIFRKYSFNEIIGNKWWWLRSIQSASYACGAAYYGYASYSRASILRGVVGLILFH